MRLIFLGPPGAGKGTQAQFVAQQHQLPHISTGEILRAAVTEQTELGQQAQGYMDRGELVPDSLILDLVQERLQQSDTASGWILDGFPRNVAQAEFLGTLLDKLNQPASAVINFDVPDDTIVERMLNRGRQDDNETTIRRRLEVYRSATAPLIEFYQARNSLISVDGSQSINLVTEQLLAALNALA